MTRGTFQRVWCVYHHHSEGTELQWMSWIARTMIILDHCFTERTLLRGHVRRGLEYLVNGRAL